MGLKDFFQGWSKRRDAEALEVAEEETHMTDAERAYDSEDYEAKKDDAFVKRTYAGTDADRVGRDEFDSF